MRVRSAGVLLLLLAAVAVAGSLLLAREDSPGGSDEVVRERAPIDGSTPTAAGSEDASLRGSPGTKRTPPPAAATPAPLPAGAKALRVRGRVVDERRKAVPNADVAVLHTGQDLAAGRTGEDGAFAIAAIVPAGTIGFGSVRARREGQVGYGSVLLRPDPRWQFVDERAAGPDVDVGTIALRPAVSLEVVVARECTPSGPVRVTASSLELEARNASGEALADAEGRCRLEDLHAGTYRVIASAPGCGRGVADTQVPRDDAAPLRVALVPERIIEVEVVDADGGAPIAGAVVTAYESIRLGSNAGTSGVFRPSVPIAPTDATGRTRVHGLAKTDVVSFLAVAEGFSAPGDGRMPIVKAGEDGVRIPLHRRRRVEFPVVAGERPVPADGTVLRLTRQPGAGGGDLPAHARMEGGKIVGDGFARSYVHALAAAPDGAMARLFAPMDKDVGHETSFRASRTIDVALRYSDGAPASGFWVAARNQGNNPMGAPVETDAQGKAQLAGLYGELVEVYAADTRSAWGGIALGSVNLEKGGGAVEGTVERERRFLLTVRVDGVPRLPPGYVVQAGYASVRVDADDPDLGTVLVRVRPPPKLPPQPLELRVQAPGYLPGSQRLPEPGSPEPIPVAVDLAPAARLAVRVAAPSGDRYRLELHRWDEAKQAWTFGGHDSNVRGFGELLVDTTGLGRLDSLAPGRYRFVDTTSGIASVAVDASAGRSVEVRLDLMASGWAKGKVIGPPGESLRGTRLRRTGGEMSLSEFGDGGDGGWVGPDGAFQIRVPGTFPVAIEPVHPLLVPAEGDGRVTVTRPVEDLVLRLVASHRAVLRFDRAVEANDWSPSGTQRLRVLVYRGEPEGEPTSTLSATVEGGVVRFAGFEPGTHTLWIDSNPGAPTVIRDAVLGKGETDLGTFSHSEGRSIVLRVRTKEGQAVPRVHVWATRKGPPTYQRSTEVSAAEGRLTGLGPGIFEVRAGPTMAMGAPHLTETVDLTTATEATLTLDLR